MNPTNLRWNVSFRLSPFAFSRLRIDDIIHDDRTSSTTSLLLRSTSSRRNLTNDTMCFTLNTLLWNNLTSNNVFKVNFGLLFAFASKNAATSGYFRNGFAISLADTSASLKSTTIATYP